MVNPLPQFAQCFDAPIRGDEIQAAIVAACDEMAAAGVQGCAENGAVVGVYAEVLALARRNNYAAVA
jgi:hypothetical protein